MTLKFRKKLFVMFFFVFAIFFAMILGAFIFAAIKNRISFPDFEKKFFLEWFPIFSFNGVAFFLAAGFLPFFALLVIFFMIPNFEKTRSCEVTFFSFFLISCALEGFRVLPTLFDLWTFPSSFNFFCNRAVAAGRIFSAIPFLFSALFKDVSHWEDAERNSLIIFLACVLLAALLPLDFFRFSHSMVCFSAFPKAFFILRVFLFCAAFVSFLFSNLKRGNPALSGLCIWYALLFVGYLILCDCDNYFCFALGSILLVFGTLKYLFSIHSEYLWQ